MTTHITKSWMEDGKLVVQVIPQEQIYKRTWVGLTDEDISICIDAGDGSLGKIISFIEAKLKEKNGA